MKYLVTRKNAFIVIFLIFLLGTFPNTSTLADDNVFFCTENPDKCDDDKEPTIEPTQDNDADDAKNSSTVGLSAWDYIKTGFALIFVIGLLFALLKFINRKSRLYNKNQLMKNVGGISLGQHKSVQLIVVGNQYYLIGVGDDVRLLKEITDHDEIDKLTEYYEESGESLTEGWFVRIFTWFSEFRKERGGHSNSESTDFSNVFNTRLEEMKEERKRQISQLTEKERNKDE